MHRYTWAALNGLDRRLVELFDGARGGTFVELGANDGLQQSNTLALETLYGWRGLLIEADPELAAECRRNRPKAVVVCAAASPGWGMARLRRDDLLGQVAPPTEHDPALALVPAVPLSELIDASDIGPDIDVLSLDVERNELDVLAGLDLERHQPRHLLVETAEPHLVLAALGPGYQLTTAWSYHDHLYSRIDEETETG